MAVPLLYLTRPEELDGVGVGGGGRLHPSDSITRTADGHWDGGGPGGKWTLGEHQRGEGEGGVLKVIRDPGPRFDSPRQL
ncbi:unnamed protein product [Merluccius merluccius]